jgi:hypothetical protein
MVCIIQYDSICYANSVAFYRDMIGLHTLNGSLIATSSSPLAWWYLPQHTAHLALLHPQ